MRLHTILAAFLSAQVNMQRSYSSLFSVDQLATEIATEFLEVCLQKEPASVHTDALQQL